MQRNPAHRLGSGPDDSLEIKKHPFFDSINWDALAKRYSLAFRLIILSLNQECEAPTFQVCEKSKHKLRENH